MDCDIGGDGTVEFTAVMPVADRKPVHLVRIGAYGWYTGHYHNLDWIRIYTAEANVPPTLNAIADLALNEDAGQQTILLGGITAGLGESQALTVTAVSSNTGLIPNPTVAYASPDSTGSLVFSPVTNASGSATVTVTVNDGRTANNTVSRIFTVTVAPVNDAPVAVNDSGYTMAEGGTLNQVAPGVLSNDTDAENNPRTAVKVTSPAHGTVTLNANGSFTYVHDGSETTSDSFTYKANDVSSDSNVATVTITVSPVNDAPVAVNDSYTVAEGGTLNQASPGVLINDTDAENNLRTAVKVTDPGHGTLTLNANGSFTYVHDGSETTSDSFTYKASDGAAASNVATATIAVTPVNDAPTDIVLTGSTVAEHQTKGTSVGVLSTTDPEAGNMFVYTLVPGQGSSDNPSFRIEGDVLKSNAVFNFKEKNSLSIRVKTTDQNYLSAERTFTISVTDLPEIKNDFDADGRSDIGCYYPNSGNWYEFRSTEGFWQAQFGASGTIPITGDFDGDGKTDFGYYAPATGNWQVQKSTDGLWGTQFGFAGTIPVVGDFDGDGRDDLGCYYAKGGNWYLFKSSEGFWQTTFGFEGTIPVVGDFDGDGRDDIGCYYPKGGNWYVFKSTQGFWQTTFGYEGTIPVVGDFDGDGKDDIGCYYPPGGNWYVFQSRNGFWQTIFGYAGTEPVVGDFDGDGKSDLGCYYPTGGNWYVFKSREGFWQTQFGYAGTIPLGGTLR